MDEKMISDESNLKRKIDEADITNLTGIESATTTSLLPDTMPNFAAAEAMLRAQNIALPSLFNRQASQSANLNSLTTTAAGIQGENVSLGLPELVDIKQPQTSTTSTQDINFAKTKGNGKTGLSKKISSELCLICGCDASGFHYGVLSCEGCKGFFRRAMKSNKSYLCKQDGRCDLTIQSNIKRRCIACRYKKCLNLGMTSVNRLVDGQIPEGATGEIVSNARGRPAYKSVNKMKQETFGSKDLGEAERKISMDVMMDADESQEMNEIDVGQDGKEDKHGDDQIAAQKGTLNPNTGLLILKKQDSQETLSSMENHLKFQENQEIQGFNSQANQLQIHTENKQPFDIQIASQISHQTNFSSQTTVLPRLPTSKNTSPPEKRAKITLNDNSEQFQVDNSSYNNNLTLELDHADSLKKISHDTNSTPIIPNLLHAFPDLPQQTNNQRSILQHLDQYDQLNVQNTQNNLNPQAASMNLFQNSQILRNNFQNVQTVQNGLQNVQSIRNVQNCSNLVQSIQNLQNIQNNNLQLDLHINVCNDDKPQQTSDQTTTLNQTLNHTLNHPLNTNSVSASPNTLEINNFLTVRHRAVLDKFALNIPCYDATSQKFYKPAPLLNSIDAARLLHLQESYAKHLSASEVDVITMTPWTDGLSQAGIASRCLHFAECGIICSQLFLRFMKLIPEFEQLDRKDKLLILKKGLMMAMYTRGIVQYHKRTDTCSFINAMDYTRDQFLAVGHKPAIVNEMYDFYHKMSDWPVDSCIAACITMFCCFDPNILTLQNTRLVTSIRNNIVRLLQIYCASEFKGRPAMFADMMSTAYDVITWGEMFHVVNSTHVVRAFAFLNYTFKELDDSMDPDADLKESDLLFMMAPLANPGNSSV